MEFEIWTKGLAALDVDCLVVGVFEEGELSAQARAVDAACGGRLKKLLAGAISRASGETLLVADLPGLKATRVLLTGLGKKKQLEPQGVAQGLGGRRRGGLQDSHRQCRARARPSRGARTSMTTTSAARSPRSPPRASTASTI